MSKFNPPTEFRFDRPDNWPDWKQRFRRYRLATKLNKEEGETQVSSLVYAMGNEAEKIFDSFQFDEAGHENNFDVVLKKFDEYFNVPRRNVILERACFYQRNQQRSNGETAEMYIRALYELAEHCEFGDKRDEHIRDRLVVGIANKELSREFQLKNDLTLANVIERVCQTEGKDGKPVCFSAPSSPDEDPVSTTPMSPPAQLEQPGTTLTADNPGGAENGEAKGSKRRPVRGSSATSAPIPPLIIVREHSSTMGAPGNQSTMFSRNMNQLLPQTQGPNTAVKQGLLGHGPRMNMGMHMPMNGGYPPSHPPGPLLPPHSQGLLGHGPGMGNMGMQMPMNRGYPPHMAPGAPPHFGQPPHSQGLLGRGPAMNMRGGPHWGGRGGGFHGDPWRGGDQVFRGRGRGGPGREPGNRQDGSKKAPCRHFVEKGTCRYGNNCIFHHPGVHGPPLPSST